ncbi:MAG: GEVED domain-containing protein, partial [Planctomycetota bacterium]
MSLAVLFQIVKSGTLLKLNEEGRIMKLINCFRTSGGFICLVLAVILVGQLAEAEYVIHESATMGPTGQFEGYLVDYTEVTQIGGHIAQANFGADFFGAIVSLSGMSDLPNGYPFSGGEVIASTVFDPGFFSSDFRTPLSVELNPGYYALVFGTDALGSVNGYGIMPYLGQTSYPWASYFVFWPGLGWGDVPSNDTRFVIEGNTKYCDASGSNYVEYQYIMGVQVGDIDNIPTANNHYADYTSLAAAMEREVGYPITVTRGNPYSDDWDRCGAWVDWNHDGVFTGMNEEITMSLGIDPCTFTGTITPPADAVMGDTRMRVRIRWYHLPLSCGDTDYGEVEDYTITVVRGDYCGASGSNYSEYQYIKGVQVGGINNIPTGNDHYADYTALYTMMEPMVGYPITVTRGNPYTNDRCGAWADWNQDGDFYDAGEEITMSIGLDPCTFTGTVMPPADAGLGDTRMRVRIVWNKDPQPCGDSDYGEVEDYTIKIPSGDEGGISGVKFNDLNGNGFRNGGEPGLAGWEIYLDLNNNGQHDTGEPNAITATDGSYEFLYLAPDTYTVAEVMQAGWKQTLPFVGGAHSVTVTEGATTENINFGNWQSNGNVVYLKAVDDTYVDSSNPDTNYGSESSFYSGESGSSIYNAYVKFDLSSIPPGNVVVSAVLRLNHDYISSPAPTLTVIPVAGDDWDESEVTGNLQPFVGGFLPTTGFVVSGDTSLWDATGDVDDDYVYDGFYSLQISSFYINEGRSASFFSKESGNAHIAPTLEVEYEPIFGGGTGEPDDPYQIWTGEQFNRIGLYYNRKDKHYKLMANISLAGYSGWDYNIINKFQGVFDGNYHTISDFSYFATSADDDYIGLFGHVDEGTIKNLKLISPNVYINSYTRNNVGAIAGSAYLADISGCSVIGGTVEGGSYVGGLIGMCQGGFIADCSSSASVSGTSRIGGLVGSSHSMFGFPSIRDCYAQGAVTGDNYVGGFIGNSYHVAMVNCYSTGLVSGTADANVGGFSGYNESQYPFENIVNGCFWDVQSSGEPNSAAGTGLTTAQMYDKNTFINAGWDFVGESANGGSDDWSMPAGGGYPILWHELPVPPALPSFAGGSGTAGDPYLIGTETQLNSIGHNPRLMDKHFELISDLDLNGIKYYMIAGRPCVFSGTFDGADHTISNILVEDEFNLSFAGFIGGLKGTGATIENLTLVDANIVSDWGWGVGSLAGMNEGGTITNCHTLNTHVVGMTSVGGLVGSNVWYGRISGCSATGIVSENAFMPIIFSAVGGLVGENVFWSDIDNSYAKCDVSGDDCVGGLVGTNVIYCIITNCYSQGSVTGTIELIGGFIGRNMGGTETNYCYSSSVVTGPAGTDSVGGFAGNMFSKEYYTACCWDSEINPDMNGIGNATDPNVAGESTA